MIQNLKQQQQQQKDKMQFKKIKCLHLYIIYIEEY